MTTRLMNGEISISRFTGHRQGISIEVTDKTSRVRFLRVEVTPEVFGNIVTGLGGQDCTFELRSVELVGMKAEYKTEFVPFVNSTSTSWEIDKKAILAPFEVDGWKANYSDFGNHHCGSYAKGFTVGFRRHVPLTQTDTDNRQS